MVLEQIDHHPIFKHDAYRLGRSKFDRWKRHRSRIPACQVSGPTHNRRGQQGDAERKGLESGSHSRRSHLQDHDRSSLPDTAVVNVFVPPLLTSIATVRFDFVKYWVATRWM